MLQGEEAHMGMPCQCPQCGAAFLIPTIARSASESSVEDMIAPLQDEMAPPPPDPASAIEVEPPETAVVAAPTFDLGGLEPGVLNPDELSADDLGEEVYHIPCPNGHELETPPEMIGQRVKCPHCNAEFRLRRENSIEYHREQEFLERKRARFWFQLAILAACFVGAVLLLMIGMALFS